MSLLKEFKEFAMKGNVIELAVGVVIGGAFQQIVNSLVNDVIMPFTAIFTGSVHYSEWVISIGNGAVQIGIGSFINAVINFLIVAFSIFIALKYINKLNRKLEEINKETISKISKKAKKAKKQLEKNSEGKMEEKVEQQVEEVKVEPSTKVCPYCLSEIPYKAVKCAHCASDLTENTIEEAK